MEPTEQTLIDGLFNRLKTAEAQAAAPDPQAEAQINSHLAAQPSAPYYMAQVILIQEAALKRLDQRVKQLEAEVAQARAKPSSGGFLAGLFGVGGRNTAPAPAPASAGNWANAPATPPGAAYPAPNVPSRAGSFLGGALQTAAGVAGGVMLADMLTGLFQHGSPQEIVEIIQPAAALEPNDQDVSFLADSDLDTSHMTPDQFGALPVNDTDPGYADPGFGDADFSDDAGFFSDDDTFV
ncbi:DUF2076 domain-containing protein [Pseudomonas sp. RIT-PI-AD]|uniref:DUF2076 domain-containing protein n=1 Tax=Pseudomonas sp. RIT-PI-AD TaxID=3035294 RepID=UPI0021D82F39|nr:DUF2076 domain-containing protein [Pseudomonas sp. RIT-PI-AD]